MEGDATGPSLRVLLAHSFYRQPGGEDRYVRELETLLRTTHKVQFEARENARLSEDLATAARMMTGLNERRRLRRAVVDFQPDVIHLHNAYPSLGPALHLVAQQLGVPLVQTVHNLRLRCPNGFQFTEGQPCRRCEAGRYDNAVRHDCFPSTIQAAVYASTLWAHRFVFDLDAKVDLFIAPSRFIARRLADWGFDAARVGVVRNFTRVPDAVPALGDRGLYIGRLSGEKGVDVLLAALRRLGDPPFDIVGGGPIEGDLRALATSLGLKQTTFHGYVPPAEVLPHLARARYVAFPSLWDENAPLAALEAMAAGRPLVASATGGLPELAEDGRGSLVPPRDADALADAIATYADAARAAEDGARARAFVLAECTPPVHLAALTEQYRRIVRATDRETEEALRRSAVPFVARVAEHSADAATHATKPSRRRRASDPKAGRPHVLMVHCYYRDLGGENLSFEAETELLRQRGLAVTTYTRDNRELDRVGPLARARAGIGAVWAQDVYGDIRRVIARTRPDVVHFQNTFPLISPAALHAAHRAGLPVVQSLRNYRLLCASGVLYRDGGICHDCVGKPVPYPAVLHACYRGSHIGSAAVAAMQVTHRMLGTWTDAVDLFVAPSEFARGVFVGAGVDADRIVVKPNFVQPDPGVNEASGQFALYAGRLAPEKGVHTMLEAWSMVPDLPLVIAGDGPSRRAIERDVERLDLAGRVTTLGAQPPARIVELLRQARLVVFPSEWYETFGRTAAEAFACGVPVVASRLGAMAEVVTEGVSGRLFTAGDAGELAAAVRAVDAALTESTAMSSAARAEYERRFTAADNAEQLLAIYDRAIASRQTGRPSAAAAGG